MEANPKSSAEKLFDFIEDRNRKTASSGKPEIGIIKAKTPIEDTELLDYRVVARYGPSGEDELFEKDDDIFNNLRRGDSLLIKDNKKYIARIGLPKFFDYKKKYKENETFLERRVLSNVKNSKGKFILYYMDKANGENLQISYNRTAQAWIVASKNVTVLLRKEEDLEWYRNEFKDAQRFGFALDFGTTWFNILKTKFTEEKLKEFIEELGDHTLVGESVGDVNHQHIKLYKERDILFYAIVKNEPYTEQLCLPPLQSIGLFNKYGLSHVTYEVSDLLENYEELEKAINKKYDELLIGDIETAGEGNVVYFVEINEEGEKVLSLAKLKSFEYRYYRKIREKCRKVNGKKKIPVGRVFNELRGESDELAEDLKDKLPMSFQKYLDFGLYVLNFQEQNSNWDYSDKFALFLNEMKRLMESGIDVKNINSDEINQKFGSCKEKDKKDEDDNKEESDKKGKKGKKNK